MEKYDVIDLIKNKYLSNHKENTLRHVEDVADTAVWLAKVYNLDIEKVKLAALLHDISAIMTPQEMYEFATGRGLEIDAAEEKYHFLLHQRISKIIARDDFDISDSDILDAIECHTTLKKNASMYDKVIFIADKISWDPKGVPPYYDTQREKLLGRYKAKIVMYEALMFLLIWYSVSTTLFQMIRSKVFISDCGRLFDTIATFIQSIAGWIILIGKNVAQISNGISNPVVAGIIYWLIRILICGGCLVGAGILVAFIGIKIAGLYKKCCLDMITILVILISMAIAIYFGDWIKTVLPINMLFLLLFVQLVYVGIRWYVKGWRETRGYS